MYLIVFVVAALNGVAYAEITPIFQVPDEPQHFAYVQHLAENGTRVGASGRAPLSTEESATMSLLDTGGVIGRSDVKAPHGSTAEQAAQDKLTGEALRDDGGGPSSASSQPPLYYAVEALPYILFASASLPVRVRVMRLVSVAMFAAAASLCAAFVAEILGGSSLPLVGGLAIALSPYAAFICSGVTPDVLLLLVSVGLSLVAARGYCRGLTSRGALVFGALVAAGALTKLIFLAVVPVAGLFFVFLTCRPGRGFVQRERQATLKLLALGVAGAAVPLMVGVAWLELTSPAVNGSRSAINVVSSGGVSANYREIAVYGWELFLPRLPFMNRQFAYSPLLSTWIDGFAGRYGWLDYGAPGWLITPFRCAVACITALAVAVSVVRLRNGHRHHWPVILFTFMMAVSLTAIIAKTGFDYRRVTGYSFEQPRYLFSFGAFYGLIVATACAVGGRGREGLLAMIVVGLLIMHDMTGLTQTLIRYYA